MQLDTVVQLKAFTCKTFEKVFIIRWIGNSKLSLGVNERVDGCLHDTLAWVCTVCMY